MGEEKKRYTLAQGKPGDVPFPIVVKPSQQVASDKVLFSVIALDSCYNGLFFGLFFFFEWMIKIPDFNGC